LDFLVVEDCDFLVPLKAGSFFRLAEQLLNSQVGIFCMELVKAIVFALNSRNYAPINYTVAGTKGEVFCAARSCSFGTTSWFYLQERWHLCSRVQCFRH